MDCRDQKGILKNPAEEMNICTGYHHQTKRASFNDNGVLKKILIERLSSDGSCSQEDGVSAINVASVTGNLSSIGLSCKETAPVIEELEETLITVPIEDQEEKFIDPEEQERRKVFEEKRKHHERVNLKELLKKTEQEVDKELTDD